MLKRALIFLAVLIPTLSSAQESEYRVMSLMSQDENGLFILVVKATPEKVEASVQQLGKPQGSALDHDTRYPRELFDALWMEAESGRLSQYVTDEVPGSKEDGGAASNYIVSTSNGISGKTYMVPKCSASAAIVSFVRRLTNSLLPAGSPGVPKTCRRTN